MRRVISAFAVVLASVGLAVGAGTISRTLIVGSDVQAFDADLTSWAAVTRAAGFDAFTATPSSANLATLASDETGSGALMFGTSPQITTGLELGHASDTTLARSAAGRITVEGRNICTVLAQSGVASSHTGNTNETTLATVTVPANSLGANGRIIIDSTWVATDDASSKTTKIFFGGTGGTAFLNSTDITDSRTAVDKREIINANATNSQVGAFSATLGGYGLSSGSPVTAAIDTTAAADIVFRGTLADGTDTITLQQYIVRVCPGV